MKKVLCIGVVSTFLCATLQAEEETQDIFFEALWGLCGGQYQGKVSVDKGNIKNWPSETVIMNVVECYPAKIEILLVADEAPFQYWMIYKAGEGLTFQEYSMTGDGDVAAEITFSGGGITTAPGTTSVQEFPADEYSEKLFLSKGLVEFVNTTWILQINPEKGLFSYQMQRPGGIFHIDFDLRKPLN